MMMMILVASATASTILPPRRIHFYILHLEEKTSHYEPDRCTACMNPAARWCLRRGTTEFHPDRDTVDGTRTFPAQQFAPLLSPPNNTHAHLHRDHRQAGGHLHVREGFVSKLVTWTCVLACSTSARNACVRCCRSNLMEQSLTVFQITLKCKAKVLVSLQDPPVPDFP